MFQYHEILSKEVRDMSNDNEFLHENVLRLFYIDRFVMMFRYVMSIGLNEDQENQFVKKNNSDMLKVIDLDKRYSY